MNLDNRSRQMQPCTKFVGWNKQVKFVIYAEGDETHVLDGLEVDPVKEIRKRTREINHLLSDTENMLKSE